LKVTKQPSQFAAVRMSFIFSSTFALTFSIVSSTFSRAVFFLQDGHEKKEEKANG
jgi:hypothetical protein